MTPRITTREAEKIAAKLGAVELDGKKHRRFRVSLDGKHLTTFGCSHGAGNSNIIIAKALGIPYTQVRQLADCTLSKEEYFNQVRSQDDPTVPHKRKQPQRRKRRKRSRRS